MKNFDYLSLSTQQLMMFVTLHELGTVTATAEKLDITQSAVSHGLQKLRSIFNDELFVRAGRSIVPTKRSENIYPHIKEMLEKLAELAVEPGFDPKTAEFNYTILCNDFERDCIFPQLYKQLASKVAKLSLDIHPAQRAHIDQLRQQDVDMVITPLPPDYNDIRAVRLFDDYSACFYDPSQRDAPQTVADLMTAQYVGVNFAKGVSLTPNSSDLMEKVDENTVIRVENFASIPSFIKGTNLLAIVPSKLKNISFHELAYAPLPYQAPKITLYMLWHTRHHKDPKHQWFRQQLLAWM